jgi:hypothetical protein
MAIKIAYWATTGLLAGMSAFAGFTYLLGSPRRFSNSHIWGIPSNSALFLGSPKRFARSPSSSPAWSNRRSKLVDLPRFGGKLCVFRPRDQSRHKSVLVA